MSKNTTTKNANSHEVNSKDLSLKEKLMVKLQLLEISPKRSLGQNFLISEHVVEQIFNFIDRREPPFILEIGPGLGTLTESLLERPAPHKLIELDRKFAQYWRSRGEQVVEADALKFDWLSEKWPPGSLILGNLPYQIGSRLVIDLSLAPAELEHLVFMFQREVAERLMAIPRTKDYGFLSVIAQTFWTLNKVTDASREDFYPSPNVSSRVIAFRRRAVDPRIDVSFIEFIKTAFQFRRKFMIKSFQDRIEVLREILAGEGIKDSVRAEELSAETFQKLFLLMKERAQ